MRTQLTIPQIQKSRASSRNPHGPGPSNPTPRIAILAENMKTLTLNREVAIKLLVRPSV